MTSEAEVALDVYLKELTDEQRSHFDAWLAEELEAGRLSDSPSASDLKSMARSWAAGWTRSRSAIVEGVHEL